MNDIRELSSREIDEVSGGIAPLVALALGIYVGAKIQDMLDDDCCCCCG